MIKQATFFNLPHAKEIISELKGKLSQYPVKKLDNTSAYSYGWTPLIKTSDLWSIEVENNLLFQAGLYEPVLSSKAINTELQNKIEEIELVEGRKVGRKEKADLKDEVTFSMRSNAPSSFSSVFAYIDAVRGLFVIGSCKDQAIERMFKHLQMTLGSFPMTPLQPLSSPASVMTDWLLNNSMPPSFETGNRVQIADSSEDKASIKFNGLEPLSEDVTRHLEQGMRVKDLILLHASKTTFHLDESLKLSDIKFDASLKEDVKNNSEGGKQADMYATLPLLSDALGQIVEVMAGEFEFNLDNLA